MGTPPGVILLGMVYGNSDTAITGAKDVPSLSLRPISCTFQDRHLRVARHYSIPLVSYRDEYWPAALGEADPTMRSFYNYNDPPVDYVHPNGAGHGKMADVITALLNTAKNAPATPSPSYSLPARLLTDRGAFGTMTEVSNSNRQGLGVTMTNWASASIQAKKYAADFSEPTYWVYNGWHSNNYQQGQTRSIEFSGIPNSDLIVEYSVDSDHGNLEVKVNGVVMTDRVIKQLSLDSAWNKTVYWSWAGLDMPNSSNTVTFTNLDSSHCAIHRLWLTGTR